MKIGVIGCGGMGTTHYLSLKALSKIKDIEVVALADCRQEFLDKAMAFFPNAKAYKWGEDLIEKEELDIVHICLPSYLHTSHAVAAMKKSMNVFIEKPVCLTKDEADLLLQTERETGVKVMVGQVVRVFEEYRYLKMIYDEKRFGNLRSIIMQRLSGDVCWGFEDWFHNEEKSGSVVKDLHIHDLDFLRYMLGEPQNIDVRATAFDNGMINQILTLYQFDKVFVSAEGLWDVSTELPFKATYRASFDEATVVFDSSKTPSLTIYKKDGSAELLDLESEFNATNSDSEINISTLGPYFTEIKTFIECVENNLDVSLAPLSEGIKSVELADKEWILAKRYVEQLKEG